MLKIKDNIDLREIEEKYKFNKHINGLVKKTSVENSIFIRRHDRALYLFCDDYIVVNTEILYDLIKADLVEKGDDIND